MINGIFGMKILDKLKIMKIYILGSKGMLGTYVYTYFTEKKFTVKEINREVLDASAQTENSLEHTLIEFGLEKGDVVINCIGTIKPRVDQLGDLNAILVNSVFPRILANVCEKNNWNLIHPTTDCVFSGKKGNYNENDKYDIDDVYGMSKALGEPKNCTIIRTSIIGEEVGNKRSLVEWVKSQKNKNVSGFLNHFWNGITCLEWSKLVEKIISDGDFWKGTKHFVSPTKVSKYELVDMISKSYNLNLEINPINSDITVDRTLSTKFENKYEIKELSKQIVEMAEFSKTLYSTNEVTTN
jgi:dTDP-4-dehydrorhamnose reductase